MIILLTKKKTIFIHTETDESISSVSLFAGALEGPGGVGASTISVTWIVLTFIDVCREI
jgi:hypothetical protein